MISEEILQKLRPITAEEQAILDGRKDIDRTLYMDDNDRSANENIISAHKMMESGRLIAIRPHTRFIHFPCHSHEFVEVVYMARGHTTHFANGNRIDLQQGELLFFGQGALQEILPAGEEDLAVNFFVLPAFFDKALEMMGGEDTPLRHFVVESLRGRNSGYLYFKVADLLPVQNLVENLLWTLLHDVPNRRSINQTTMGLLFMQLLGHTDRLTYTEGEDPTLLRVFRYIEENYIDGSLTNLASLLHYDIYHLSRLIRQETGKTYTMLLQEKRLDQAAWLLRNTSMHVEETADAVGYTNQSYFHRIFKERYHLSPRQYRAQFTQT